MLMLIHGDNTGQSRNYYLEIRNKYKNQKLINGDKLTMTELVEAVEGDGLFSINEAVFVEQFLSKNKIGKDFDALLDYLNQEHEIAVILWESKEIDKKQIAKLKKATTKLFSYPKTLFQLLDAVQPHNGKNIINLFHQTLQTEAVELILFMLTKQVRILLALTDNGKTSPNPLLKGEGNDSIDEVKRIQSWQMGKLQKQAKLFSVAQLKYMHSKLYEFDLGYKTGGLAMPLESSLDFFFASI